MALQSRQFLKGLFQHKIKNKSYEILEMDSCMYEFRQNFASFPKQSLLQRNYRPINTMSRRSTKFTQVPGPQIGMNEMLKPNLWKPFLFTIAFSTGSFIGVTIWEYENVRSRIKRYSRFSSNFSWFKNEVNQKKSDIYKEVKNWWDHLTPGEKFFAPICALNIFVFGLWRIPRLQPYMMKYFCSNPISRVVCWPMVLSTFSHYSMFHIFANMYVLYSFSNVAISALGKEQLLGLYLSAGVVSTLASYIYKIAIKQPGFSLGASGAIMAILALVCTQFPDTQLSILFLPMFTFSAGSAIKVIMGLDLAGCILRWKLFDHAAHLGGATFGIFWYYFGSPQLWPKREYCHKYWHQIRSSK